MLQREKFMNDLLDAEKFAKWAEKQRLGYQKQVSNQKLLTDKQSNEIIKLKQTQSLVNLEEEIFGNQLKNLYNAIENLSSKKFVETKFSFQISELEKTKKFLTNKVNSLESNLRTLLTERDKYLNEV